MLKRMREIVRNKVSEFRTKAGWTQEQLADTVHVSRQTVIAIEKGNYTPSVLLALKIAKVFKAPLGDIFSIAYEK